MKESPQHIPQITFRPTGEAQNLGIDVLDLREIFQRKKPLSHNPFAYHRIDFFAILIITRGSVRHKVDFEEYELKAGELIVIAPEQIHAFDKGAVYEGYIIVFTESFLYQYLSSTALAKIYRLFNYFLVKNKFPLAENRSYLDQLVQEFRSPTSPNKAFVLGASLTIFIFKTTEAYEPFNFSYSPQNHQTSFHEFWELLLKNFHRNRNASFYADKLGISYKHLNVICKSSTGQTAKTFIDTHLILEAKRQLTANTQSIKEVAYSMGFDEPTNFVKYFRKRTGQSPLDFRRSMTIG